MVKRITMDVHGYKVSFADRGEVWLQDDDVLYFGNDLDFSMKWDGTNLEILPVSDNAGSINIGDGETDVDLKVFLGASSDYVLFDVSEGRIDVFSAELRMVTTAKIEFTDAEMYIHGESNGVMAIVSDTTIGITAPTIRLTGNVTIPSDNYLYIRDTGIYIYSPAADRLEIKAASTGRWAIRLLPGTGGGIDLGGYLGLYSTDTDGAVEAQMWFRDTGDLVKYKAQAAVRTLVSTADSGATQDAIYPPGDIRMIPGSQIRLFPGATAYIVGAGTDQVHIVAESGASHAVYFSVGTNGCVNMSTAYLVLQITDTDSSQRGAVWFDASESVIKFYNGTITKTVATT